MSRTQKPRYRISVDIGELGPQFAALYPSRGERSRIVKSLLRRHLVVRARKSKKVA